MQLHETALYGDGGAVAKWPTALRKKSDDSFKTNERDSAFTSFILFQCLEAKAR